MSDIHVRRDSPWGSLRRSPWLWLALAAVALALTVTALVLGPLRTPLAALLASEPADGYRYTRSSGAALVGGSGRYEVLVPFEREIWIAHDGSGRLRESRGEATFFGPNDRAEWSGTPTASVRDEVFGPGTLTYTDFAAIPSDPEDLRAHILQSAMPRVDRPSAIFATVAELLRESVPPEQVRTAADRLLATTDGITRSKDGSGNIVYTVRRDNLEHSITLDAVTHELLGEQKTLLFAQPSIDADPPVVTEYVTYLESREVDRL